MVLGGALLLARIIVGIYFIRTGWEQLQALDHSQNVLNFFRIPVPAGHQWDPFFPCLEILCGILAFTGFMTRGAVLSLLAIMTAAVFSSKFKELTGLDPFFIGQAVVIVLLAALYMTGPGTASLDRLIFKRDFAKQT